MELILDCHSGISGDRLLAAFIGLGADPRKLQLLPLRLGLRGVTIATEIVDDGSTVLRATVRIDVSAPELRLSRASLHERIELCGLSVRGVQIAAGTLDKLLAEEARTIGLELDQVELSGDAAVEALLTIVGGIALWSDLGAPRVTVSGDVAIGGASSPSVERLLDRVPTLEISDELQLTTSSAAAFLGAFYTGEPSKDSLVIRQAVVPMGLGDGVFRGQVRALICDENAAEDNVISLPA